MGVTLVNQVAPQYAIIIVSSILADEAEARKAWEARAKRREEEERAEWEAAERARRQAEEDRARRQAEEEARWHEEERRRAERPCNPSYGGCDCECHMPEHYGMLHEQACCQPGRPSRRALARREAKEKAQWQEAERLRREQEETKQRLP